MQPVSSPCQAAETVTARPRTSCTLQACSVVKIPRVTQKDFWTIEDFRDLRDQPPSQFVCVRFMNIEQIWSVFTIFAILARSGPQLSPGSAKSSGGQLSPSQSSWFMMITDRPDSWDSTVSSSSPCEWESSKMQAVLERVRRWEQFKWRTWDWFNLFLTAALPCLGF